MKRPPRSLLLAFLLVASGCAIRVSEQDIYFRRDPGADTLDLLLVYRGVSVAGDDDKSTDKAVEIARAFLDGRRRFCFWGVFCLDLDDLVERLSGPPEDHDGEGESEEMRLSPWQRQRLADALDAWRLRERGAFLDEEGRLCGYQVFRVERFAALVRLLNELISRAVLHAAEHGELASATPLLEDPDRELWVERARADLPWFSFDGREIVVDLPLTRATYERIQGRALEGLMKVEATRKGVESALGDDRELLLLAQLLAHLRGAELSDDRLVVRFGAPGDGTFHLRYPSGEDEDEYDAKLLDALREKGVRPAPDIPPEELLEKIAPAPEPTESAGARP